MNTGCCDRCRARGVERPGKIQPSDGDAAMLYIAAHGETLVDYVRLCSSCCRTLEAMSLRACGTHVRAGAKRGAA